MTKFKDKKGIEIREFSVLKFFHYVGPRRRKYFMYKWVRKDGNYLVAMHLTNPDGSVWLKALCDSEGTIDCEVVQDYSEPYIEY